MLSVGDIARETGLSRQRIWQLAIAGRIPAKQAKPPGKQYRFYDSAAFIAWRKQKASQRAVKPVAMTRAQRISRKRWERIECLQKILVEKKAVHPDEKEMALRYIGILGNLWVRLDSLPLLEGIHALVGSKGFRRFDVKSISVLLSIEKAIEELPTRSAPRQRRSSAASAQ